MKKKLLVLSLISSSLLCGCNFETPKIDFNVSCVENKIIDLDLDELYGKLYSFRDSFILATHDGNSCTCWTTFSHLLTQYNEKRKSEGKEYIPLFAFDTNLLEYSHGSSVIQPIVSGYSDLYFIKDGEIEVHYTGAAKKDMAMFEDLNKLEEVFDRHIQVEPMNGIYYIDYDYYLNNIKDDSESDCILFTIRSGCSDCSECLPNIVYPFVKSNRVNKPIYVLDIEKYYSKNDTTYTNIKNDLFLTKTSSEEFGYSTGFVPTYQYWKNGVLTDAGVYSNDTIDYYIADGYYYDGVTVRDSYFDGERTLKYTTEIIKGKSFNSYSELIEKHKNILESFLNYYCI